MPFFKIGTSAEIPVTRISSHSENVCLSAEISQSNSPVARKDRKPKLSQRILTINLSLQPIYYEIHRRVWSADNESANGVHPHSIPIRSKINNSAENNVSA